MDSNKEARALRLRYRNVFCSPEGQEVFKHMLKKLCFYDDIETEQDRILHNYAKNLFYVVLGLEGQDAINAQMASYFQQAKVND